MKKYLCFLLTILIIFCVSCADSSNLAKNYGVAKYYDYMSDPLYNKDNIPKIDNTTPHQTLITQSVDIHTVAEKLFCYLICGHGDLAYVASTIGIECLRETENGALYSVHKIKQGGLLYVFYYNDPKFPDAHFIIRWFYVDKSLSSNDFEKLKLNSDTIDTVIKIDKTIQIFKNLYNARPDYWKKESGMPAWIYLNDGILELEFKCENDKPVLLLKKHISDFNLTDMQASVRLPYNAKILDMDKLN